MKVETSQVNTQANLKEAYTESVKTDTMKSIKYMRIFKFEIGHIGNWVNDISKIYPH